MRRFLPWLLVALACMGATLEPQRTPWTTAINGLALTSSRWTGWMGTTNGGAIALEVAFTDANSSNEAVTMRCETDDDGTATNDAGADVHSISLLSNGTTSAQYIGLSRGMLWCNTGSNTTCGGTDGTAPGSSTWTWTVEDVPDNYLNCLFDVSGGSVASADTVIVKWRRISP